MISCEDELYHHGIKGMKWGVRRYQNPDGTLTAKGMKRYQQGKLKLKAGYAVTAHGKVDYETDSKGRLTKAGAREWRRTSKEAGDMSDTFDRHLDAYDRTPEGKKRRAEYDRQIHRIEFEDNWGGDKDEKAFEGAEKAYLKGQYEYAAKQLIAQYGRSKVDLYADSGPYNKGKDAVEALSEEWEYHRF